MRVKRCLAILPLIFLPFTRVWASPIYSPRSPRMLGGLGSREEPNVGLQIGMPVVVTITVPLPVRTPEAAVQESTITLPCGSDPSPSPDEDPDDENPTTSVKQPPLASNSPGAFVPVPSVAEQEFTTTIHISTTVTEYVTLPPPTSSTSAQQPDTQPPLWTPSPATPQSTVTPSSSSITLNTSVPLIPTPDSASTDSSSILTTSTLSFPAPVPETTTIVDTEPETPDSDDSGPAIEIIPVS